MFLGRGLLRPNGFRLLPRSSLLRHAHQTPALHRSLKVAAKQNLSATVSSLANELKTAQDLSTIHSVYPTFVEDFRKFKLKSQAEPPLQPEDVANILRILASSGRPEDLQRIEELLYDLGPVFEVQPSLELYTTIVEAFGKHAPPRVGLNFLAKMPTMPGGFIPKVEHFLAILEPAIPQVPFAFIRDTVSSMPRMGCRPNADIANVVIRAFWRSLAQENEQPTHDAFIPIFDLFESLRIPYSTSSVDLISRLFDDAGLNATGQKVRSMYELRFKESSGSNVLASKIAREAQTFGVKAACDLVKSAPREQKLQALRHILQSAQTLADIEIVESELDVTPDVRQWTTVISNCCRADNLSEALRLYEAATSSGLHPDAGLISPILRCLWRKSTQKRSDEYIDKALALYDDLRAAVPPSPDQQPPQPSFGAPRRSRGPDSDIYHTLFRLLSRNRNLPKYFPIAARLLGEMKEYKLPTNVSAVAAPLICLGIQSARKAEDAVDAVNELKHNLDEEGYAIVLQHFSKKQFGPHHVPSIQDYFRLVRDMKKAGFAVTPKVYNIMLTQIGYLATKLKKEDEADREFLDDLINATRRTHDLFSLDASMTPDPVLLSQFINTYQRLGCFGDAYRVWELMYLTGTFNCVTVSNILDGCGWAGDVNTALNIWRKLSRDGFTFDLHNWNTMVECLCRCGRLEQAQKMVFQDMLRSGRKPTLDTLNILLKFARNEGVERDVLEQIEKHLPALYRRVQPTNANAH